MKAAGEKIFAFFIVFLTAAAAFAAVYRLMRLQIVEGGSYLEKSLTTTVEKRVIDIPRGEIVDAAGQQLVSNRSCFNCIVDKAFFPVSDSERNRVILETALILENSGCQRVDLLPLSRDAPFVIEEKKEGEEKEMRRHIGVQVYATPDECIAAMCDNYGIDENYSSREKRVIAGVRYSMDKRSFSVANTYTFAEDIPMDTVIEIKEHSFDLAGIDIAEAAVRTYGSGDVIPHLIGTVGAIDADEYAELREKGYSMNDTVGKSGIELAMEGMLRGKRGEMTIEMQEGQAVSSAVTDEAVPGNTVKLTVESDLQRKLQTILENHISWLQHQTLPDAAGTDADAGALVVLDVKTGALLGEATAPTYNLNDYIENYSEVISRPNAPLTNRAVNGLYRPGSTFKPITAAAALNEGIISPETYVRCSGQYDYWDDYKPKCTGIHGSINVVTAIRESCNIFFYETGRITGIDTIKNYAEQFGLAGEAGLETGRGISRGRIACPETYESLGMDWQAGNIVQAAIGQSETAVTPLQMAAAAMTIANRGVRYRTYMVDSVYTYNMESLVSKTEPVIACTIPDKTGYTFDCLIEGMKQAADFDEYNYPKPRERDYYTGKYTLKDLPGTAAIKTGTPQITSQEDTGSAFIGFYPAEDPEIAFAGFIEHGEYSKFMVRQIIEAYLDPDYTVTPLEGGFVPKEHDTDDGETVTGPVTDTEPIFTEPEYTEHTTDTAAAETAAETTTETETGTSAETVTEETVTDPPVTSEETTAEETETSQTTEEETVSETTTTFEETEQETGPPPETETPLPMTDPPPEETEPPETTVVPADAEGETETETG